MPLDRLHDTHSFKVGLSVVIILFLSLLSATLLGAERPNVILIMTDDHGYGDIAAHGHPHLKTPNMDRLHRESVRLADFHVDPTCSPTRAALLTGRYSGRVGVWHTIMGRNMLRDDETTAAQIFKAAGYRTGIFGKWHLGDTYPYAPRFRGFDDAIVHGAGGVGQTPDFWGNDYTGDHYNDNGTWRPFEGYCTDVWFREAMRFIAESKDQPFFLYLPTNVAHQTRPHAPEQYRARYKDADTNDTLRTYWAMLDNFDENLGILLERMETSGQLENTILLFMSDNGTCMGQNAYPKEQQATWSETYNGGMRASKGSHYDGGHRVFCFIRHPAGGLQGGREVKPITAHIDILPTLLDLCAIAPPAEIRFDGRSIVPLLKNPEFPGWPERILVVESQRVIDPVKWRQTSVMTDRWRLVNNKELYDIQADPGQRTNLIQQHTEVVARLSSFYDTWWADISRRHNETTLLHLGSEQENPVQLNAHDWMPPMSLEVPPWNQPHVERRPIGNGTWHVRVVCGGRYAFTLRERPAVAAFPLRASEAQLQIGDQEKLSKQVPQDATGVRFELDLAAGETRIKTWLIEPEGKNRGAYFVDVEHLPENQGN
jgi:arylsulfatase A-like enzyme